MKKIINMTTSTHDTDRYQNKADLRAFYKGRGLDGLELMFYNGFSVPDKIPEEDIVGVHLSYFPYWVDFWRGNESGLIEEFGSLEKAYEKFGSNDRSAIVDKFISELDNAQKLNAEYVVFHVSDVKTRETFTYKHSYSDHEVIESTCELVNEILSDNKYSFYFLMENLWWPGFSFTSAEITKMLLDGVNYNKKGIMLDTGHLLHTNRSLRNQEDAIKYIHDMLDAQGDLCSYIKGIHLNQSLSGEYVEDILKNPPQLNDDYTELYWQAIMHVYKIDSHLPFTARSLKNLIDRIDPLFLTHELITNDLEEHTKHLDMQLSALSKSL